MGTLVRYLAAQALVAVSTVVALWIAGRWGSAAVEMIYLPAVLAAAVWWGFGPALLAAMTSALAYNFFFTEPLHTFRMDRAVDIVDVTILFLVAVVTASSLRQSVARPASPRPTPRETRPSPGSRGDSFPAPARPRSRKAHAKRPSSLLRCNTGHRDGNVHPTISAPLRRCNDHAR